MGSTIVRQWHILTLLPKGPRRIDTATLEERLRSRGIEVHRRTIQRDLVELASVFSIVSDERSKPYGWRWADGADVLCTIPPLRGAGDADGPSEIDLLLHVRAAAVEAVSEGLRGPEGAARAIRVGAPAAGASGAALTVVQARVADGCSLRRWLFGFADALVVVAPAHLRAELAVKAARTASVYEDEAVAP